MVFNHLKQSINNKTPELAFFFDSERNYQKLVVDSSNDDKESNAFNQTRSLWVFTDELINDNAEFRQQIHHTDIVIISDDYLDDMPDRFGLIKRDVAAHITETYKLDITCDVFLFINNGSSLSREEALFKFKADLMGYLASKGEFSSFQSIKQMSKLDTNSKRGSNHGKCCYIKLKIFY